MSEAVEGIDWVYRLLHVDDYWEALCSIKRIDEAAVDGDTDEFVGEGPQSAIAVSLLQLLTTHHETAFESALDDYETALASGAPSELRDHLLSQMEASQAMGGRDA